ncbi:hypothetical protein [Methylobacter sp. BlB1]|uniref:hypothetical protein n=1 Tax=Methylobacter sp. BlB1 TaxID=2785914 RepID=UPI001895F478|nr:hypothetical protein [Methylobacter sp. BlB1]MBF6649516.1 hypothetical protein [Methylobacter sp. BlB1]
MAIKNKVVRLSLAGGLIGLLTTNPRRALDDLIDQENQRGWGAIQIQPHRTTNLFVILLQLLVLLCTLGLWTWGAGYLVLFQMDTGAPK